MKEPMGGIQGPQDWMVGVVPGDLTTSSVPAPRSPGTGSVTGLAPRRVGDQAGRPQQPANPGAEGAADELAGQRGGDPLASAPSPTLRGESRVHGRVSLSGLGARAQEVLENEQELSQEDGQEKHSDREPSSRAWRRRLGRQRSEWWSSPYTQGEGETGVHSDTLRRP